MKSASSSAPSVQQPIDVKEVLAKRAAQELRDGYYVNLGIGIPTLVANYIPAGMDVTLQSENGLMGIGPFPADSDVDPDLINAGKQTVTAVQGASYFSSADSFGMIRGGHIDLSVLGGLEVASNGDLANWVIPGKMVKGMGGAMDLVASAKRVVVVMTHNNKDGEPKILKQCTLPLTGKSVVNMIITEKAVFEIEKGQMVLIEVAPSETAQSIRACTAGDFTVSPNLKTMAI